MAVGALMLLAVISSLPFFYAAHGALPEAHDLAVHWSRMKEFDIGLRSGVWYPRWLGGMNHGYGAATTLFYAPLTYYALSGAHALTHDWSAAIEVVVLASAACSAAAFFVYARTLVGFWASIASTTLYLLLPYRLIDLYHRCALAELLAMVWMPLVVLFLTSAMRKPAVSKLAGAGIFLALLIVTHPPVSYLFVASMAVFVLVWSVVSRRVTPLLVAAGAAALGACLSAFYWLPAMVELKYAKETVTDFFRSDELYVTGLLRGGKFQQLIAAIMIVTTVLLAIFMWVKSGSGDRNTGAQAAGWTSVGLLSAFMMTPLADPLVRVMPGIETIAFQWRWLSVEVFATSILAGFAVERLASFRPARRAWSRAPGFAVTILTAGVLIFGMISSAAASNLKIPFAERDAIEDEFTPRDAPKAADLPISAPALLVSGRVDAVALMEWQPERRTVVTTSSLPETLDVRTFYFPGWRADVDGLPVEIGIHPVFRTMLFDLTPGRHVVNLTFGATTVRQRSQQMSALAAVVCAVLLCFSRYLIPTPRITT